jgi:hypothetical protein
VCCRRESIDVCVSLAVSWGGYQAVRGLISTLIQQLLMYREACISSSETASTLTVDIESIMFFLYNVVDSATDIPFGATPPAPLLPSSAALVPAHASHGAATALSGRVAGLVSASSMMRSNAAASELWLVVMAELTVLAAEITSVSETTGASAPVLLQKRVLEIWQRAIEVLKPLLDSTADDVAIPLEHLQMSISKSALFSSLCKLVCSALDNEVLCKTASCTLSVLVSAVPQQLSVHALDLCQWFSGVMGSDRIVYQCMMADSSLAVRMLDALGRLICSLPDGEAQRLISSQIIIAMTSNVQGSLQALQASTPSGQADAVSASMFHLDCLMGLIKGLLAGHSDDHLDDDALDDNDENASDGLSDRNTLLQEQIPPLASGLLGIAEALGSGSISLPARPIVSELATDTPASVASWALSASPSAAAVLVSREPSHMILGQVFTVLGKLLDSYNSSEAVISNAIGRLLTIITVLPQPNKEAVSLATVLLRQGCEEDSTALQDGTLLALATCCLSQCLSYLHGMNSRLAESTSNDNDKEAVAAYATEVFRLCRQLCATRPSLFLRSVSTGNLASSGEPIVIVPLLVYFDILVALFESIGRGFVVDAELLRMITTSLNMVAVPSSGILTQGVLSQLQDRLQLLMTYAISATLIDNQLRYTAKLAVWLETIFQAVFRCPGIEPGIAIEFIHNIINQSFTALLPRASAECTQESLQRAHGVLVSGTSNPPPNFTLKTSFIEMSRSKVRR